jgi:hypothetical protein
VRRLNAATLPRRQRQPHLPAANLPGAPSVVVPEPSALSSRHAEACHTRLPLSFACLWPLAASHPGYARLLGDDPATGQPVFVRDGLYGAYVQRGVSAEEAGDAFRRQALPKVQTAPGSRAAAGRAAGATPRHSQSAAS